MFSNLSYQDREAFFGLLDEYFASRPHLLAGGGGGSSAGYSPTAPVAPVRSRSSSNTGAGGRTLPPPAPASSSRSPPPFSPPPSAGAGGANGEKPDMATRMVTSGFKMGASGARKGLGMLSKNENAMNALGRAGAAGMIRSAQAGLGPGKNGQQPDSPQSPTYQQQQQPIMSPPPTRAAAAPAPRAAQAKAVYDYSSGDSGDLDVQGGQVVTIVEKTSADWWTCSDGSGRQGLVPASYLQEM